MNTDETQGEYIADQEASEALAMLGKGYEPAVIIERPRKAHGIDSAGLEEFQLTGWVKMSAKFCVHIKKLKGAKLAIWLCLALVIDENGECGLTQKQLCALTGYSHTEVIDSVSELDEMGLLSVDRSGKKNLYRPSFVAKGKGNSPTVKKLDSTPLDSVESSPAREKSPPTSSKKEQEYSTTGTGANKNIFAMYESNIGPLTPLISDALKDLETEYPNGWIVWAISEAVEKNARSLAYIRGCLEGAKKRGSPEIGRDLVGMGKLPNTNVKIAPGAAGGRTGHKKGHDNANGKTGNSEPTKADLDIADAINSG